MIGVPHDWQMGFPASYTPLMDKVESLHDLLLVIITLISLFVLALLLYVVWRFHASRNPVPTTTTHNTVLEIAWTILPILILVVIAIPSFRLLYYGDKAPGRGDDGQGDRPPVVLELRISRPGQLLGRQPHPAPRPTASS